MNILFSYCAGKKNEFGTKKRIRGLIYPISSTKNEIYHTFSSFIHLLQFQTEYRCLNNNRNYDNLYSVLCLQHIIFSGKNVHNYKPFPDKFR